MTNPWLLLFWVLGHILYSLGALYYIFVSIPAYLTGRKDYVLKPGPGVVDIRELMERKGMEQVPLFKFQITTRGWETHVVARGIRSILTLAGEPLFRERLRIDVVTEEEEDRKFLEKEFCDSILPLHILLVPPDYQTPKGTLKKARALHYMIERRREEKEKEDGYIVYLDSESVMEPEDFRTLVFTTLRDEKLITEGPIAYPLRWFDAPLISRQMEATRPWHCYHCHHVMVNPPPQHLHGSNLVVEEGLARELGWDFGNLDGEPFIAEDLIFGLVAYLKYGEEAFGWHGAQLLEQPAMSVGDSVRQRVRWVFGIWQALEMLKRSEDFGKLPLSKRLKLRTTIAFRATLYSLGFFSASFFFLFLGLWVLSLFTSLDYLDLTSPLVFYWSLLLLAGLFSWLGSTQVGLSRILERRTLTSGERMVERLKILAITPVAALVETSGALYATTKWFFGFRKVTWIPTKK